MKDKRFLLNALLTATVGIVVAVCVVCRAFLPYAVLPQLNLPTIALLSLVALTANAYLAPKTKPCYLLSALVAAVCFGLFPWLGGFLLWTEAIKTGVIGGITFLLLTVVYTSLQHRAPASRFAPLVYGFGLYLAAQGFVGILL